MDDGNGAANGRRFGITEAAHHGDERTALLGMLQRQRELDPASLVEETARHLGHIDLLREQPDGSTGEEPGQ